MIAGSWLQIGSTTSHFCSGEATPLRLHVFKWNISPAVKNPILLLKVREIQMAPASRSQESCVAWQNRGIAWYLFGAGLCARSFPQSEAPFLLVLYSPATRTWEGHLTFFPDKSRLRGTWSQETFQEDAGKQSRCSSRPLLGAMRDQGRMQALPCSEQDSQGVRIRAQSLYCSACWKSYPLGSVS